MRWRTFFGIGGSARTQQPLPLWDERSPLLGFHETDFTGLTDQLVDSWPKRKAKSEKPSEKPKKGKAKEKVPPVPCCRCRLLFDCENSARYAELGAQQRCCLPFTHVFTSSPA